MEKEPEQPPPPLQERRRLRLSGKAVAFGLVMAFLATGILIPWLLKYPVWIDVEIVLAAWWGIWLAVLTTMLYHGNRVTDDHQLPPPRSWLAMWTGQDPPEKPKPKPRRRAASSSNWGPNWYYSGPDDGEGCLWVLGVIVAMIVLGFALWFLIEVAIPLVLFVLYLVARGMLSRVINDRHHCKGRLGRSIGWALVWATVYTVPLAAVVWCVHFMLARSTAGPMVL